MDIFQVALHAEDLDRAGEFYTRLFGSPPTGRFDPPGLLFFQVGGTRLLLEKTAPSSMIYLRVDDIDVVMTTLRELEAEIVAEPHVIFRHQDDSLGPAGTDEWQAFFKDSEGNLVGLICHRQPL